jgi:hypothetical protein
VDDVRVQEIYDELSKLVVALAPDPVSLGPGYLQDLISKTRGHLNQTSHYLTQVLREQHDHEMLLSGLEDAYQIASDDRLANDRQVSTLPAVQDRLAMVNVLLADERRRITAQKRILKNLGLVEKVVRHRHKELENTMSAIRLQRSLVETELRTGAYYGDENDQSRGSKWGKPHGDGQNNAYEDLNEDEISRLLREAEAELEAPGSQEVTVPETAALLAPSTPPPQAQEDDAITRFLNQEEGDDDMFKDL